MYYKDFHSYFHNTHENYTGFVKVATFLKQDYVHVYSSEWRPNWGENMFIIQNSGSYK